MKERFDPGRLDVAAFARAAGELSGEWPQTRLQRFAEGLGAPLADAAPAPVRWSARGELRQRPGAADEVWLHLRAATEAWLTCQRCLAPLQAPLEVERWFLFVDGEAEAERLDEERDDDVLALTRSLDLAELIEDELILALPIVPRHEVCPQPLPLPREDAEAARDSPFAVLESLRSPGSRR